MSGEIQDFSLDLFKQIEKTQKVYNMLLMKQYVSIFWFNPKGMILLNFFWFCNKDSWIIALQNFNDIAYVVSKKSGVLILKQQELFMWSLKTKKNKKFSTNAHC